jgi:hypothetical protein
MRAAQNKIRGGGGVDLSLVLMLGGGEDDGAVTNSEAQALATLGASSGPAETALCAGQSATSGSCCRPTGRGRAAVPDEFHVVDHVDAPEAAFDLLSLGPPEDRLVHVQRDERDGSLEPCFGEHATNITISRAKLNTEMAGTSSNKKRR